MILKLLAEGGVGSSEITVDCLKKANDAVKLSSLEHYISFSFISPFLDLLQVSNNGFKFKFEKDKNTMQFQRVAVLFPYSLHAKEHCFKVYGIDAAFLDGLAIKGKQRKELRKYVPTIPLQERIMFQKNFLSGISGRTLNNEMILYAVCISYNECSEDYDFLFDFLRENEVNITVSCISFHC